jgi:hypothetical protein
VVRIVRAKRTRDNTYCYWPVFTPQEEGTGPGDNRCCRTGSGFSLSHYGFGKGTVVVCVTGSRREHGLGGLFQVLQTQGTGVSVQYLHGGPVVLDEGDGKGKDRSGNETHCLGAVNTVPCENTNSSCEAGYYYTHRVRRGLTKSTTTAAIRGQCSQEAVRHQAGTRRR